MSCFLNINVTKVGETAVMIKKYRQHDISDSKNGFTLGLFSELKAGEQVLNYTLVTDCRPFPSLVNPRK